MSSRPVSQVGCTDALCQRIGDLIRSGVPRYTAGITIGLEEKRFEAWLARGLRNAAGDWRYARFRRAVFGAEAECEAILVAKIRAASSDHWQAAAWLAERRFPERWLRKSVNADPKVVEASQGDPFAELDNVTDLDSRRR